MKFLVAILFLINCLAFFMYSHMQKQSELKRDQLLSDQRQPVESPQPVVLLSELSLEQLQALNAESNPKTNPDAEKTADSELEQSSKDVIPPEIER